MRLIHWTIISFTMLMLLSACSTNLSTTNYLDENLIATWRFIDSDSHFMTFLENGQGFNTSCAVLVETGNEDPPIMECAELRGPLEHFRWETEDNILEITFYFVTPTPMPQFWEYELIENRLYFADFGESLVQVENVWLKPAFDLDDFGF